MRAMAAEEPRQSPDRGRQATSRGGAAPEPGGRVPGRVWSGTALQAAGRIYGAACTFAILALLARHLPTAEFGLYTFYLGVFLVLDALADFGTGAAAVQHTSTRPDALARTLAAARRVRLVAGGIGFLVLAVGTHLAGEADALWLTLAGLYPLTHVLELSTVPLRNRIDWRVPAGSRALASTVRIGLVLGLWSADVDSAGPFVLVTALGSSTANLVMAAVARRMAPVPRLSAAERRALPYGPLLRLAAPLGIAGLAQQAYFHVDNLFVRPLAGAEQLGLYNAGVRLMSFGIMVVQYAGLAALPWLARLHAEGRLAVGLARLGQPLFVLACAGAGLALPLADRVLALLFGPDFSAGGGALAWLLGALCMIYLGALHLTAVVAVGRTGAVLAITAVALAANLVGNAWAVPRFGIEGAAATTLLTEGLVAAGALVVLARAGVHSLGERPLGWLSGPAAFALGAALTSALV